MIERFGELIMRLPQGQPHIKVWFTLYSIHLQVQCYIQVMVPAGAINKIKCWKLCVAGVITNYEITWLDRGKIVCEPNYRLPAAIHPTSSTAIYGRSLYEAEEDMNTLEQALVKQLTAIPNVLWWHRNIARHGFAINGYFNHYPDIMIMTQSGKIILAETKGEHLKNDDSQEKIELGAAWRNAAGNQYRYYMVFRDEENLPHGAVSMGQFVETVEAL